MRLYRIVVARFLFWAIRGPQALCVSFISFELLDADDIYLQLVALSARFTLRTISAHCLRVSLRRHPCQYLSLR